MQFQSGSTKRGSKAKPVKPFGTFRWAVKNSIFDVMMFGFGIRSNDKHFMPHFSEPFRQYLNMGDHSVNIRQVRLGKHGDAQLHHPFLYIVIVRPTVISLLYHNKASSKAYFKKQTLTFFRRCLKKGKENTVKKNETCRKNV